MFCRSRKTLVTNTDKGNALNIPNVVIRSIMPCIDFELQDVQTIHIMRNHLHLWQRIHIVANLSTDSFAHMLYIIKTSGYTIIINAKEKGSAQTIGKSTYAFQPALGFLFFQHQLKIVCGTFCYQSIQIHCYDDYYIINQ